MGSISAIEPILILSNPVAVVGIPIAVSIGTAAGLADERGIGAAAVAPFPAHNCQMKTAGGPIVQGAIFYFGSHPIPLMLQGVFITKIATFHGKKMMNQE